MKHILFILGLCLCCRAEAKLLPYDYALLSETENNSQFDLAWHAKLASYGDPESQFFMGKVYEQGKLIPKNTKKAVEYYKKSAMQGFIESIMALVELLPEEKIHWLTVAAKDEYIPAQLKLSEVYERMGDKTQAIFWLEKAMQQMFPNVTDLTAVSPKLKELKETL